MLFPILNTGFHQDCWEAGQTILLASVAFRNATAGTVKLDKWLELSGTASFILTSIS